MAVQMNLEMLRQFAPDSPIVAFGCFFFISGYFMELSLQRSGGKVHAFLRARLIKIYQPYLIAFALYVFVLGFGFKSKFDVAVWLAGLQFIFSPSLVKPLLTLWYVGAILLFLWGFSCIVEGRSKSKIIAHRFGCRVYSCPHPSSNN